MRHKRDLSGLKFGDWVVIRHHETRAYNHIWWCRCVCGKESAVHGCNLGRTSTSCGCQGRKRTIQSVTTHGRSKTRTHSAWINMKSRCHNPRVPAYRHYGARGIFVCDRWIDSFDNFFHDMGEAPRGMTLERKNNSEGYSPNNCMWATPKQQARNKRNNRTLSAFGKTMLLRDWSLETGIKRTTITQRIDYYGWSVDEALGIST